MSSRETCWFIFHDAKLLLRRQGVEARIPRGASPPLPSSLPRHDLGRCRGAACAAYAVLELPDEEEWLPLNLRAAYAFIGEELYTLAGKGCQLIHWDKHTRYCPACGTKTLPATTISKKCPACGHELFPPLAVAVLALILRGDSALLVRARSFRGEHFGLVAGFLEPGETLEECVQREALEETGLNLRHIRYFGSQPWPYPSGLMAGFVAESPEGEIRLQTSELLEGRFFFRDEAPLLPQKFSLARRMIDWWLEERAWPL